MILSDQLFDYPNAREVSIVRGVDKTSHLLDQSEKVRELYYNVRFAQGVPTPKRFTVLLDINERPNTK